MSWNRYRVKGGTHAEGKKIFVMGDEITSDVDLVKLFGAQKFEHLGPCTAPEPQECDEESEEPPVAEPAVTGDPPASGDEPPEECSFGKNVTEDYPIAADEYLVFKKGPWHTITTADDWNKAINPKGIKADAVEDYLEDLYMDAEDA